MQDSIIYSVGMVAQERFELSPMYQSGKREADLNPFGYGDGQPHHSLHFSVELKLFSVRTVEN
jgi:hypothetical protein